MNVAVSGSDPLEVPVGTDDGGLPRWSSRVEWFDWLVLGMTAVLAAITIWVGSSTVSGMWDAIFVSLLWAFVGVAWSLAVLLRTTDRVARIAVVSLLVGSFVTLPMFGPITMLGFLLILPSPTALIAIGLMGVGLLALVHVRQRPIRLVWLAAPATVVVAFALVASGVPRSVRFAAAEPALTRYVQSLGSQGAVVPYEDEPIDVGGIPVYAVIQGDGQILLVTGYIGILGDDAAGLAYVPGGQPVGVGDWEHLMGPWYSWTPY